MLLFIYRVERRWSSRASVLLARIETKRSRNSYHLPNALRLRSPSLDTAGERRLLDQRSLRLARITYGVGVEAGGRTDIGVNVGVMFGVGVGINGIHPL